MSEKRSALRKYDEGRLVVKNQSDHSQYQNWANNVKKQVTKDRPLTFKQQYTNKDLDGNIIEEKTQLLELSRQRDDILNVYAEENTFNKSGSQSSKKFYQVPEQMQVKNSSNSKSFNCCHILDALVSFF